MATPRHREEGDTGLCLLVLCEGRDADLHFWLGNVSNHTQKTTFNNDYESVEEVDLCNSGNGNLLFALCSRKLIFIMLL